MSNAAKLVVENSRKEALILDLQKEISGYKNQIELAKENEQAAKEEISEIQNKYDTDYWNKTNKQQPLVLTNIF